MATTPAEQRPGAPSFESLAPLLDRLVELAERELSEPYAVHVDGWDDGDFNAYAHHNGGVPDSDRHCHERVEYDVDDRAFVHSYVEYERDRDDVDVRRDRVLEAYPCPVDVPKNDGS